VGVRQPLRWRRVAAALLLGTTFACDSADRITGVASPVDTRPRYPGFDIALYPGDAALTAWRFPVSPYYWVGYYLAAPCHRDGSFMGTRARVTGLGWGTLVIYVGQQDWVRIPNEVLRSRALVLDAEGITPDGAAGRSQMMASGALSTAAVTCSATLLSSAQGASEGADAVAKTASEGFSVGSTIYLDVEYVTGVAQPLVDYVSAWVAALLADGRYVPAVYAAKSNAPQLHDVVVAAFAAAGRTDMPKFWIASSSGFTIDSHPADVGLSYAAVWQGRFNATESWGGITRVIDVDVATTPSPSSPSAAMASAVR
jgi:hypothetical protein